MKKKSPTNKAVEKVKKFTLRPYQAAASKAAVDFLLDDEREGNGLIVAPTGSGKSLLISDIVSKLGSNVLVLQPTREILDQNYKKMLAYVDEDEVGIYSASFNRKDVRKITFATIGSIKKVSDLFQDFKYVICDECHYIGDEGMYRKFFDELDGIKILGLTATPYRLESEVEYNFKEKRVESGTSILRMLTSMDNPLFDDILYAIQVKELSDAGYLAKTEYFYVPPKRWEQMTLFKNSSGSDYSDKSVRYAQEHTDYFGHLVSIVRRLMHPKSGKPRNGILVFTRFVEEAEMLAREIERASFISGKFTKKNRVQTLEDFQSGKIQVLANASVLVVGYDRPDLDTIVLATPTMSLARFYQEVGRVLRISPKKESAWIVDLCGNLNRFGRVEDLVIAKDSYGDWEVFNNNGQLTDVELT